MRRLQHWKGSSWIFVHLFFLLVAVLNSKSEIPKFVQLTKQCICSEGELCREITNHKLRENISILLCRKNDSTTETKEKSQHEAKDDQKRNE